MRPAVHVISEAARGSGLAQRTGPSESALDQQEIATLQSHAQRGRDAIENAQFAQKNPVALLEIAKQIVYSHHEWWDGSGYPQGIKGDEIPIPARLMALADAYDDLVFGSSSKPGLTPADAATQILFERGTHFDPDVVDAFIEIQDDFTSIAANFPTREKTPLARDSGSTSLSTA